QAPGGALQYQLSVGRRVYLSHDLARAAVEAAAHLRREGELFWAGDDGARIPDETPLRADPGELQDASGEELGDRKSQEGRRPRRADDHSHYSDALWPREMGRAA